MTEEPTDFQHEHALEKEDDFLDNFYRLPEHTREAIALIVKELAKAYRAYQ